MRIRGMIVPSVIGLALVGGSLTLTAARRGERVERVDFDKLVRAISPAYDARVAPVSDADIKEFRIPIKDATLEIAKGVTYQGWTFGGTVPGPVIHVRVGDRVRVTVINNSPMPHSIDFHDLSRPFSVQHRPSLADDLDRLADDNGRFGVDTWHHEYSSVTGRGTDRGSQSPDRSPRRHSDRLGAASVGREKCDNPREGCAVSRRCSH